MEKDQRFITLRWVINDRSAINCTNKIKANDSRYAFIFSPYSVFGSDPPKLHPLDFLTKERTCAFQSETAILNSLLMIWKAENDYFACL